MLYFLARRRVPAHVARRCACAWLFNPLAVNVSTRGNAESLTALLLLLSLHALAGGRPAGAGGLLAAATHLKLYPVIYAPAFVACLEPTLLAVTRARLAFVGGLVAAWTALAALAYGWCGEACTCARRCCTTCRAPTFATTSRRAFTRSTSPATAARLRRRRRGRWRRGRRGGR